MNKNKVLVFLILVVAAAVRLYNLAAASLWHDEAFSALLINYSWGEMFHRIALDVHPPLYYVLLRFWADIFGHSLFALRGFSAFFGVAAVFMTYMFVKTAFKRENLALVSALLMAVSPFQIQFVTEARMYTLGCFLVVSAAYFLVKALEAQRANFSRGKIWTYWIVFALCNVGMFYTHYYLFFSAFALGLYVLYFLHRNYGWNLREYKYALISYLLLILAYVPWLKTFSEQFGRVQDTYWIPKIDRWSVFSANWRMILGTRSNPGGSLEHLWLILGLLFTLFVIYKVVKREQENYKWLVFLGLIVPFLGSFAISLKQSIFLDRYFVFAAIFLVILLALYLFQIQRNWLRYFLTLVFASVMLLTWAHTWQSMNIGAKQGMKAASSFINNNSVKEDNIIVASSFEFFNFKYYNKTQIHPLLYTPGVGSFEELPHFVGTPLLSDEDITFNYNDTTHKGQNVWVLWTTAFGGTKPVVPDNWIQIDDRSWEDIHPYDGTWIVVTEYRVE